MFGKLFLAVIALGAAISIASPATSQEVSSARTYTPVEFVSLLASAAVHQANHEALEKAFLTKSVLNKVKDGDAITGNQDWSDWKVLGAHGVAPNTVAVDFLVQGSGTHTCNTYHLITLGKSYRVDRITYRR